MGLSLSFVLGPFLLFQCSGFGVISLLTKVFGILLKSQLSWKVQVDCGGSNGEVGPIVISNFYRPENHETVRRNGHQVGKCRLTKRHSSRMESEVVASLIPMSALWMKGLKWQESAIIQ